MAPESEPHLNIKVVETEREWEDARSVREAVFIREQACPPEEEWDEHEESSRHLVGYVEDRPVAAARWRTVSHDNKIVAKLERFAVLKQDRGRGFGRSMVGYAIHDARQAGFDSYLIHAQEHLQDFYANFGFRAAGEPFMEANIRHVPMELMSTGQSL